MEGKVATDEARPTVQDVTKKFSVLEDGAYALQVQEELNAEHYGGNISRRRTVRSDLQIAKSKAEEEALEAFREEHEIAERNRHLEEKDKEAARKMLAEEAERARLEEERDQEIARQLQMKEKEEFIRKKKELEERNLLESERLARSLSHEDQERAKRQQAVESEDALAALRLSEQRSSDLGVDVGEVNGGPDVTDDELIARQLQAHEKDKYLLHKKKKEERKSRKEAERLAMQEQQEGREQQPKYKAENGEGQVRRVEDDERIARQIHREEIQRAMAPDEERLRREKHDAEIAKKMQHAEVLRAKERKREQQRRRAEADGVTSEERGHRHEPDQGHRHDPHRAHRHDPDRGDRQDPGRGHHRERDPPKVARNPMVDSYPKVAGSPREEPASHIQPVQGQRRSSAKEQEKEKKSKGGLFSKSKKK